MDAPLGSEVFSSESKGDPQVAHYILSRAVQREIGLTDEQAEKIDAVLRREGKVSNRMLNQFRNTHEREKRAEVWAQLAVKCAEIDDKIKELGGVPK